MEKVLEDIKSAKEKYDYVFIMPHWGIEYTYFPTSYDRKKAIQMINAGADGIIGSHTHQIQPWLKINQSIVYFSLGNFLFPDFYMLPERPICYPCNQEEAKKYPISYTYPKKPNGIIRRVWKKKNRNGIIAEILIDNKIKTKTTFIRLDENNNVTLLKNFISLNSILKIIALLLRFDLYRYFYGCKCLFSKIIRKIVNYIYKLNYL